MVWNTSDNDDGDDDDDDDDDDNNCKKWSKVNSEALSVLIENLKW